MIDIIVERMSLNLLILNFRIIAFLFLLFSCSPNPFRKLDDLTQEKLINVKTYINSVNESSNYSKCMERGRGERLTAYYDREDKLIKIKREINETNSTKEYHFYFKDNQFIASQHKFTNSARIKNKCLIEVKEFYYSEGKTIFATQKSSIYTICTGVEMQKLERKTPKKLEAPGSIYSDELLIIEKLKNFINQKN